MGSRSPKIKDTFFASVLPLVREQHRLAGLAERQYSVEVDTVIRELSRDSKIIERLLDGMLGFCFEIDMLGLYKKLCRYYFKIDPQATAFYVHSYLDMWDDAQAGPTQNPGILTRDVAENPPKKHKGSLRKVVEKGRKSR